MDERKAFENQRELVADLVRAEMRTINHFSLGGKSAEQEHRYTLLEAWLARAASPAPTKPMMEEFLSAWKRFHDALPDGEYLGLGEVRIIVNLWRKAEPQEVTPLAESDVTGG